ncbi:MazG family protein [Haloactinomyces albus]|uniref:XTP/dITP diphosphohydrolase n=1 Tax=Haloactinomyces albus TaxID=1352928 RepID=A0AAE4CLX1_9ACTN|nr:MazG family protein [Haloactinomyces albus]MDR7302680.1 XTP/dITP diphosphohydrolase [Haloactinomyces albus]
MTAANEPIVDGCALVLVDDRLGEVVPAAAVPVLRAAVAVYADAGLAPETRAALDAPIPPPLGDLLAQAAREPVVLVASDPGSAEVLALHSAGAQWLGSTAPAGVELLDAVTVMDRLRSPGGCPWDAEQTHDSLRQYLVEETYELLEALERRDRTELREELGDVLLQVLFHARVATEDSADPFDVDEVASKLVSKLVSRHPHVFSEAENIHDAESQHLRWEELKQQEKRRESSMDGVATGQPAVALAAKLAQRAARARIPADLLPQSGSTGNALFDIAARAKLDHQDPEDALRAVALRFAERVRAAESRARQAGREPSELSETEWRRFWSELPDSGGPLGDSSGR